ncbi:hypothetical protein ACJ77P_11655 [Syntrophus buswellii]|uniref:hypothetical protein n=1 Tax=Syntrophus buswellii TaxID=43774 RepID=UPI0038D50044
MTEKDYSTNDISKALFIKKERLRVWIDEGFVTPSIHKGVGPGTKHIFSIVDVYGVELFRRMLDEGFNRHVAAIYVKDFTENIDAESDITKILYVVFQILIGKNDDKQIKSSVLITDYNAGDVHQLFFVEKILIDDKFINKRDKYPVITHDDNYENYENWWSYMKAVLFEKNKDWNSIYIVNFSKLRNDVEAALLEV